MEKPGSYQFDHCCSVGRNMSVMMKLSSVQRARHICGHKWFVTFSILLLMCLYVNGENVGGGLRVGLNSLRIPPRARLPRNTGHGQEQNETWIIGKVANQNICRSVDIRNNMVGWQPRALAECDIIEGSLRLIVINQNQTHDAINNISFPRLKQVTDYILFYRVFGLKTFTHMFPNLAVIRGHRLFHEYALVVFENLQLSSVGLIGLRRVLRGTVRFEKNTQLCFLDTVDWQHITNRTDHIIQDNSENSDNANEPVCKSRGCSSHCSNFTSVQGLRPACWNDKHCQLLHEPLHCHPYCEGGCTSPSSARHCVACKHVNFNGTCMGSCPRDTYLFEGWRCIRREECNLTQPGRPTSENYKAFNGSCIYECPVGYTPTENKTSCKKCDNECPKSCQGRMIDSAARAQAFKGCTVIKGSLRIQVSGENIVKELEESLADIREIDGFLRVSYSAPLVSLTFLSNLRIIRGKHLESDQYALYFLHNHNLLTLWPDSTNLTIVNGRAFFHFNHKLCLSVIHNLLNRTGLKKEDAIDVGELTNGDKVPCERKEMRAWFIGARNKMAVIAWANFRDQVTDYRTLLGYNIFYREAPEKNVSLFSGRDACGGDVWNAVDYIATPKENETVVRQIVRDLKPYTQYAFYVETLMAKTGNTASTGQSKIQYFTSAPAVPTVPRNMKVYPLENALRVEWDPPAEPNGIITHYYLVARYTPETLDHNYAFCKDPGDVVRPPPLPPVGPPAFNSSLRVLAGADSCECPADGDGARRSGHAGSASSIDRANKEEQNWFEDLIQNTVFRKKDSPVGRGRRSINTTISNELPEPLPLPQPQLGPCVHRHIDGWCKAYEVDLPANDTSKNSTVLRDLHYFAEYTVEVYACQHLQSCRNESQKGLRSPAAIASRKTLKNDTADTLPVLPVISNQTTAGQVMLTWVDPPLPNGGHVLSYVIHIRRVDGDVEELSSKRDKCPADRCDAPPCRQEQQLLLAAGNNSIQVQARTLAGLGPLSPPLFYLVADPQSHLSSGEVIAIVIGVLLVVTTLGALAICYRRNTKPPMDAIYTSWNPYYGGQMIAYQPDEWEVAIEKVYFDRVVGTGSFGSVYEGTALLKSRDPDDDTEQLYRVAIKTLLEDANMYERQAFLAEASLMKEFRCHHVVRLMGIVSNMSAKTADHIPRAPFVIMELMAKGDLKSYLRSMRPEEDDNHVPENYPVLPHIYKMAIQIADGMAYLAQMNSVHRDLAARNCLVSEDITIKIGDFGMTRHLYDKNYYRKDGKGFLPVRWMGPESLLDGRFTSQSDVWSFGVVLWEMATYGAQPYQGLSNEEVMKHVTSRNRMSRPETCPQRLYDIMLQCWQYRPTERPSFVQLVEELLPLVDIAFASSSFYHTQRPEMLVAAAAAAAERAEEPEPTVLTPLTAASGDAIGGGVGGGVGVGGTVARHARMAEAEDLTDEDECDLELRPIAPVRPIQRADPEANYAEFEAMKLEGRNGGHGSLSSAENSKAHSLQFSSSDGSKDSKASNGSARNGYIASGGALSLPRTAEC